MYNDFLNFIDYNSSYHKVLKIFFHINLILINVFLMLKLNIMSFTVFIKFSIR